MSDLTARLLAVEGSREGTHWYRNPDGPEAAAEIERLTSEVARWKRQSDDWQKRGWEFGVEVDRLQARVAELTKRAEEAAEWMLNMAQGHESLQAACDDDDAFMHSLEARAYRECYVRCAALSEPPTGEKP